LLTDIKRLVNHILKIVYNTVAVHLCDIKRNFHPMKSKKDKNKVKVIVISISAIIAMVPVCLTIIDHVIG